MIRRMAALLVTCVGLGAAMASTGCIVHTRGHGHVHSRDHRDDGPRYHCHEKGGPHKKKVCHKARH